MSAAARAIHLPVSTEPVSETMSTSAWVTSAWPAGRRGRATTLSTPFGQDLGRQLGERSVVTGVVWAGFSTTVLPVASAGPIFQTAIISG